MKANQIEIKGVQNDGVPFVAQGLKWMIGQFFGLRGKVVLTFNPGGDFGSHYLRGTTHSVRIGIGAHVEEYKHPRDIRYYMMDTILHELRHATQCEYWEDFNELEVHSNPECYDAIAKYRFSKAELDARAFACKYIQHALDVHDGKKLWSWDV